MIRPFTILALLFMHHALFAQEWQSLDADDATVLKLRSSLAEMTSIRGDIRQEKSFAFLTEKLVSTGYFIYQKENRLRWEFTDPIDYVILINGNSMRLKEEGEEKKYKGMNQILRQVKEIILGCIDGSIMTNADYHAGFSANDETVRIQLRPKARNLKEFIEQIEVQFGKEQSMLQEVTLTDPSGDRTEIHFSSIQINEQIDASVFADF